MNLVRFTEEMFNKKLRFLCSVTLKTSLYTLPMKNFFCGIHPLEFTKNFWSKILVSFFKRRI